MNAHFPQNEIARAEAYGIGEKQEFTQLLALLALTVILSQLPPTSTISFLRTVHLWQASFKIT